MKLDIEDEQLKRLLERCVAGDEDAWEQLHATCGEMVFRFCYSRTRNADDAEEIANEVWFRAFRGLKNFRAESSFTTWLFRIAHHALCDYFSRPKPPFEPLKLPDGEEEGEERDFPDPRPDPAMMAEQRERLVAIEHVLSKVKPECRKVFELARQQYSGREMAEILGEPEGSISARLTRCRKNAMKLLQEAGLVGSQS